MFSRSPIFIVLIVVPCSHAFADKRAAAESPFGINGCAWSHLGMNTDKFDRDAGLKRLRALKEAGVRWDRCDFWWGCIEPEKGRFVWRDVDWVVEQYVKNGIELMPILCYGSAWQKSDAPVTDEERALYARYVYETVKRYKKHIKVWEIWNEPNITPFWSPNPDPKEYAKLLKVAYEAAKRADRDCTIVGAATAGTDLAFIEGLLLAGGGEHMDVVSIHPYQGDLGSLSPDKGGLADQIRGVQMLLAEHGYRKPIWLTELGHRTTGTHGNTSVTEAQQAVYLVRTYAIALASGAERIFWFNLQDWEEYWGIIRQDFSRKPSFDAYRAMVKQLEGKRVVGTLGDGAVVFAREARGSRINDPVVVSWAPQDDDSVPDLARKLPKGAEVQPLPQLPPASKRTRQPPKPPELSRERVEWHVAHADERFRIAAALAQPSPDEGVVLTIPAEQVPAALSKRDRFELHEPTTGKRALGERDLDGNLVFVAPPSDQQPRQFIVYPVEWGSRQTDHEPNTIANPALSVRIPGGRFIESITHKPTKYTTRSDETNGIFSASYEDTSGQWPRTTAESVRVIEQKSIDGAVIKQHRSRLTFGQDDCEYEFTVTLYGDLPRMSYVGRWISPGKGATKQVNLGDAFPGGTVVTGMYGKATLPSAGVGYGPACVIQPSDHDTVTAVMVSDSGRLNTPGWATRSVVGAGLFYQTTFPATVKAEYFWYGTPPPRELSMVAREHYLHCAFPPAVTIGPLEKRSR